MRMSALFTAVTILFDANSVSAHDLDTNVLEPIEVAQPYNDASSEIPGELANFLATVFHTAYQPGVRVRAVMPWEDWLVGIREHENEYTLFALTAPIAAVTNYWTASMLRRRIIPTGWPAMTNEEREAEIRRLMRELPTDFRDIEISSCEARIGADTAQRLIALWHEVIAKTRPKTQLVKTDSSSLRIEAGESAAIAYFNGAFDPPGESNSQDLARLVFRMQRSCANASYFGNAEIVDFAPELDDLLARVRALP